MHAGFQLSVSTLTLMSGHSLGKQQSLQRLNGLITYFIFGVILMTVLLLVAGVYGVGVILYHDVSTILLWAAACAELTVIGVVVWLFYFRPGGGTMLWIPRLMAEFLAKRCKKTASGSEALSLGLTSVVGELIFLIAPISAAAVAIAGLPMVMQISSLVMYVLVSILPLIIVFMIVRRRGKISLIQKWREDNKNFIQFMAGSVMLALGLFIYVYEIIPTGGMQ